jgi:hypothetical protein
VIIAQARKVLLEPKRLREEAAIKGRATPVILFAAHITPNARPFLRINHWSIYNELGLQRKPLPMAHITPWVAMRCHISVEKEDRIDPTTVMSSPVGAQYVCRCGYLVNRVNVTGDIR